MHIRQWEGLGGLCLTAGLGKPHTLSWAALDPPSLLLDSQPAECADPVIRRDDLCRPELVLVPHGSQRAQYKSRNPFPRMLHCKDHAFIFKVFVGDNDKRPHFLGSLRSPPSF